MKAVIPAAGLGTRLRPLTNAMPKELLPIGRKPVLAWVAEELLGAGVTEALFIVNERKPQIRAYFGDFYAPDETASSPSHSAATRQTAGSDAQTNPTANGRTLRCEYVHQREQRGLGDALLYAEEWVGNAPFLVAFGDCLIDAPPDSSAPLRRLIETHAHNGGAASVLVETVDRAKVWRYGVLAPEHPLSGSPTVPFAARDIVEKPKVEDAPSNCVVAARWILPPEIFYYLHALAPDPRGEINLTDAVRQLRQDSGSLWAVPLLPNEARRDIGNFESFFANFIRAALRDPELGAAARQAVEEKGE